MLLTVVAHWFSQSQTGVILILVKMEGRVQSYNLTTNAHVHMDFVVKAVKVPKVKLMQTLPYLALLKQLALLLFKASAH